MKTSRPFALRRRTAGVALVLVLSILILLTAIVVAFFTNAATDLTASKNYSDGVKVKLLGASTVNLVEGQIRAGTQGGTADAPLAWASQPGLIRTYDTKGVQGTVYKLYSSDTLQVASGFNPNTALATEIPTDWNLHPSDFVDLNSPTVIKDSNGTIVDPKDPDPNARYSARYPIIDGNNLVKLGTSRVYDGIVPGKPTEGGTLDGVPDIEGFAVDTATTSLTYSESKVVAPNNNPVPMPVRWLYMLQDGQLHARVPASSTDPNAGAPGTIPGASAANPVVSRIAFWTDDDTSKLNINTASEGTAWDRPRGKSATEVAYSIGIPAQNEFQMFSGHPAKDCLSTVFGAIWPVPSTVVTSTSDNIPYVLPSFLTTSSFPALLPYFDLAPRVTEGMTFGSGSGTQSTDPGTTQKPDSGVIVDADRLYTSVDEIMFQPKMATDNVTRLARNDAANTGGATKGIPPSLLETSRFFLTSSNRSPEVTLLNTPRVSLWPLQAKLQSRTAKDKLLLFCSTIPAGSANIFAFQRLYSSYDFGASGIYSCDSPTLDFDASQLSGKRNQQLYAYLQKETNVLVPGLGGKFSDKYGGSLATNQILTEMVDMTRSVLNVYGASSPGPRYDFSLRGQTVPLIWPSGTPGAGTKGFGQFPTITEASLDFFLLNDPAEKDPATGNLLNKPLQLGAALILQPFTPTPGYSSVSFNLQVEVVGLNKFVISKTGDDDRQPMGFPAGSFGVQPGSLVNVVNALHLVAGNTTAYNGLLDSFYGGSGAKRFAYAPASGAKLDSIYPLFNTVTPGGAGSLPAKTTNFDFYALDSSNNQVPNDITIFIYSAPFSTLIPKTLIQTLHLQFPVCTNIPIPGYESKAQPLDTHQPPTTALALTLRAADRGVADGNNGLFINDQTDDNGKGNHFGLIGPNDVMRSVIVDPVNGPSKGDIRVMVPLVDVPSTYFHAHPFYKNGSVPELALDPNPSAFNKRFAESLRLGTIPGYGALGYYDYNGATTPYLLGAGWAYAPSTPLYPRKAAYSGTLIALKDSIKPYYDPAVSPSVPFETGYTNGQATGVQLTGTDGLPHPGDWDSGAGALEDGPYINKPDEGNSIYANTGAFPTTYHMKSIYYSRFSAGTQTGQTYSPNRQVSSAVMFGSLPTGVGVGGTVKPWQTLLFCPNPAAGLKHPGFGVSMSGSTGAPNVPPAPPYTTIPDHYLLDLFTMPIVEPYAISEPLSTQGKVNMNYQIAPFTYIKRDTAVRAVFKSTNLMAIPSSITSLSNYKALQPTNYNSQYRYPINPHEKDGTLKTFEDRFNSGDIFRSASEICSVPLVPAVDPAQTYEVSAAGVTADPASLAAFWNQCQLTGDNVRETPYNDLYPRLTTKSNTYTVHVRVQTLKKSALTAADTFIDPVEINSSRKDAVTAEYRGSYQIERYVDPNSTTAFPDYADPATTTPISTFYKFHTIGTKQF